MKNKICYIKTENKKYPLVFNINVMEEIQEQYGSMDKWGEAVEGDGEPIIKNLKAGLMAMINEGIDILNEQNGESAPFVTSKQLGRIITSVGIQEIVNAIKKISTESIDSGEESKNA